MSGIRPDATTGRDSGGEPAATARLTAVMVVGQPVLRIGTGKGPTAIDKRPVTGPVAVTAGGLVGDRVFATRYHGGPDKAVYAYAGEDAAAWAAELGRPITPGMFGENLRTAGLDVSGAVIGEVWQVGEGPGSVLLEVSMPRVPCGTFTRWMGEPNWVRRFTRRGAPGAYLRVRRVGRVEAGDAVRVRSRPEHGVTVGHWLTDPSRTDAAALLAADRAGHLVLAGEVRRLAVRTLSRTVA